MPTMEYVQVRKGMTILGDNGELLEVVDRDLNTPGNWRAILNLKLRNFKTGNIVEKRVRPQDKVGVVFKALDANDQPVQTEGTVKVTRDYWWEIWIAPDGREVKGGELKTLRDKSRVWPPPPVKPNEPGWRLKFRGYEHDDILTRTLKTDTNGRYGRAQTAPEQQASARGLSLAKDDPEPSQIMMASSKSPMLVTTLDLIHK